MPSKRNKAARAAQLQPQAAQQSDYDTDTANLTDNVLPLAVVSPPPPRSNAELNLLVLRRHYPEIEKIIAIGPFASLYLFAPDTQQWEKCDTQGTLFVCQLYNTAYPHFRAIILNRKNLENFTFDIVSTENIEMTEEYVIVQKQAPDGSPQVYGIWILSHGDDTGPSARDLIRSVILDCANQAEQYVVHAMTQDEGAEEYMEGQGGYDFDAAAPKGPPYSMLDIPVHAQQIPQVHGQQIDLAKLFSKPQASLSPGTTSEFGQEPRFQSNVDTEFFRGLPSAAAFPR